MHDCEEKLLHEARIKSALENMPSEEETQILYYGPSAFALKYGA